MPAGNASAIMPTNPCLVLAIAPITLPAPASWWICTKPLKIGKTTIVAGFMRAKDRPGQPQRLHQCFRLDAGTLVPAANGNETATLAGCGKLQALACPLPFLTESAPITIPANTKASLLLDQSFLTNAYLTANFSGGDNAGISFTYCESPMKNVGNTYQIVKPNRNEVEGYKFVGRKDSVISDGTAKQSFTTLAFRTYRYILVNISTKDEPLTIDDIYGTFTGYPFKFNAKLNAGNPEMQQMLDIGFRTARSCAMETYFDCPYYEQLQYIGDGRIQALISYYNTGDDRLARNALNQMDHSRLAEGITLSRHPSFSPQIISTFSLWYISMLHDYWMYRNDEAFVRDKLDGARQVLAFFARYQQADGSLKNPPYWRFVDWVGTKGWDFGQPPKDANGNSAMLDMQLLWTCSKPPKWKAR
jgi:alpha-L-rhamnosidase